MTYTIYRPAVFYDDGALSARGFHASRSQTHTHRHNINAYARSSAMRVFILRARQARGQ